MNTTAEAINGSFQKQAAAQILVVDDETTIFDVFAMMFPEPANVLATAANGTRALELVSSHGFDMAFVDCFLGTENGAEVAQKLRKVQPDLNVVLMSGFLREERAEAMELAGARAFLSKPFSFETAQALARRLLGSRKTRQQDASASKGAVA